MSDIQDGIAITVTVVVRSLARDPLADRFEVWAYSSGEVDVDGRHFLIQTIGAECVDVCNHRMSVPWRMSREAAIDLRDQLEVALSNTRAGGEA